MPCNGGPGFESRLVPLAMFLNLNFLVVRTQLHDLQREERKDEEASGWQKSYTKFQNGEINIHNWKYWNSYLGRSENLKDEERQGAPAVYSPCPDIFLLSYEHSVGWRQNRLSHIIVVDFAFPLVHNEVPRYTWLLQSPKIKIRMFTPE
jgi:hypothetical protein